MEQAQPHRDTTSRPRILRFAKVSRTGTAICALVTTCAAWPCSGVGPLGKPVVFGDQTNIVIWDEAHHTEHFIRNANFRSNADNFGFIAPTPGKPTLEEASNQAFYTLASLAPRQTFVGRGAGAYGGLGMARSAEVKVIQEADVAGFHATTLWSTDAHAINDWMNEHGYVSTPEVEKWAERYCSKRWFLTAFKVIDKTKLAASTGTVRMTFQTRKPFNPFYVPSTNIQIDRKGTLRVYFVSVGDYEANLGKYGTWETPQWTAPIPWTTADLLAKQINLPAEAIPNRAQVETFVDNDFPRPAPDDIYFTKKRPIESSPVQGFGTPTGTPPQQHIPAPLILGGLGVLAFVGRRRSN